MISVSETSHYLCFNCSSIRNLYKLYPPHTQNTSDIGGTSVRDSEHETYSATLKCHDPNGELYFVNFSRDQITLNSYEDDAIRTKVETWADTVPALA